MNLSLKDACDLVSKLKSYLDTKNQVDVALCPPSIYLSTLSNILNKDEIKVKEHKIKIGAQNTFYKDSGAYTGEISPLMLRDLHIDMVIVGHSERRQYFQETDEEVNLKVKAALKHNLIPILCIGEDLNTREKGQAYDFVKKQLTTGLQDINQKDVEKLIIAYEPIWAIGTGKICSGEDANKMIKTIRETVKEKTSYETSEKVRILYGGSIKSDNFSEHIRYIDIDGGLVGGASLSFEEFSKIIDLAAKVVDLKCY